MVSGSPHGVALMRVPPLAAYVTSSSRRKLSLHTPGGRKISSLPSNNPPNEKLQLSEKLPQPWILALLQWTLIQNSSFQHPPSSIKRKLLSFVLQICLWFAIVCMSLAKCNSSAIPEYIRFCWPSFLPFCFKGWQLQLSCPELGIRKLRVMKATLTRVMVGYAYSESRGEIISLGWLLCNKGKFNVSNFLWNDYSFNQ